MFYLTIKELEKILPDNIKIVEVYQENKWIVTVLSSGVKIKD